MRRFILTLLTITSFSVFAAPKAIIETNLGSFTVELNQEKAPISVANFMSYAEDGSYVGSIFHRVIPGFMAQGGGFDKDMNALPVNAPIKNEAKNGLVNNAATIAMARTNVPDSATRQFFINLIDNDFLNNSATSDGYAVFGKVTDGFDVIQEMAKKPTQTLGRMQNVPQKPIIITKVILTP